MENQEKRKVRAEFSFGIAGHEWEYVFIADSDDPLPSEIGETLQLELGDDWEVVDRGTRIEIKNKQKLGLRDDEKIQSSIEKVVSGRYDLHILL
jgi:hypothetical protein